MTPRMQKIVDSCPSMLNFIEGRWQQIYDLSALWQIISTMAAEQQFADYPLFGEKSFPCERFAIDLGVCALSVHALEDTVIIDGVDQELMVALWSDYRAKGGREAPSEGMAFYRQFRAEIEIGHVFNGDVKISDPVSLAFVASLALDAMAIPNLVSAQDAIAPRGFRRRHAQADTSHKVYSFVRTTGHQSSSGDEPKFRKALHFVSGHWRKSSGPKARLIHGDMRTWISGHWRGDPELGVILKKYVAKTPEAA